MRKQRKKRMWSVSWIIKCKVNSVTSLFFRIGYFFSRSRPFNLHMSKFKTILARKTTISSSLLPGWKNIFVSLANALNSRSNEIMLPVPLRLTSSKKRTISLKTPGIKLFLKIFKKTFVRFSPNICDATFASLNNLNKIHFYWINFNSKINFTKELKI